MPGWPFDHDHHPKGSRPAYALDMVMRGKVSLQSGAHLTINRECHQENDKHG